jgi:hypothetical protein
MIAAITPTPTIPPPIIRTSCNGNSSSGVVVELVDDWLGSNNDTD